MTVPDVNPFPSHRVVLTIGDEVGGWFSECAGLTIERHVEGFSEGGVNDHQTVLPGPVNHSNVTLRHGVAGPTLWQWFLTGAYDAKVQRQNVTITFLDGQGGTAATWDLIGAFPSKVGGVSLSGARTCWRSRRSSWRRATRPGVGPPGSADLANDSGPIKDLASEGSGTAEKIRSGPKRPVDIEKLADASIAS